MAVSSAFEDEMEPLEIIYFLRIAFSRYDSLRGEELRDEKIDCSHLTRFGTLTAEQQ